MSHVEGLLHGRHAVPAAEARAHVQEARQHLASSGTAPENAFGSAEVYAMRLAEGHEGNSGSAGASRGASGPSLTEGTAHTRWRVKKRTAPSDSKRGRFLWLPALACGVFSFEAEASKEAGGGGGPAASRGGGAGSGR